MIRSFGRLLIIPYVAIGVYGEKYQGLPLQEDQENIILDEIWKNFNSDDYTDSLNKNFPRDLIKPLDISDTTDIFGRKHSFKIHTERDVPPCKKGEFKLANMKTCRKYLTCGEIFSQVSAEGAVLQNGLGKQVRVGMWSMDSNDAVAPARIDPTTQIKVAYVETRPNRLNVARVLKRVLDGVENLLNFQPSFSVTQVMGHCFEPETNRSVIITEFCNHGSLSQYTSSGLFTKFNTAKRVETAIGLIEALDYLHNSPLGTRVNCDMPRLHRSMSQFLVTDDGRVVLNDIDDIPLVDRENGTLARCLWGKYMDGDLSKQNFLAPEQRLSDPKYSQEHPETVPPYDEKIDIWKIPDMVIHILQKNVILSQQKKNMARVLMTIRPIMNQCKELNPRKRPSTTEILDVFRRVLFIVK